MTDRGHLRLSDADPAELFWGRLRASTEARIGLGRAGDSMPTAAHLALRNAHAVARDAIHVPLDVPALVAALVARGFDDPVVVPSRARDRAEYLRRPDLGREPASLSGLLPAGVRDRTSVAVVIADGLSTRAVEAHAVETVDALRERLPGDLTLLRPVVATQARVAIGDEIGRAHGADAVVVLIGERPGLSVTDSLGAYLTWGPRGGRLDSERNCVSNIREPGGLSPTAAAETLARLLVGARELGRSGVDLKDESAPALPGGTKGD